MLEKILVVDADVTSRDTFYDFFSSTGYQVTCVPNGKEALLRIEHSRYDLFVIDEQLPASHLDCYETMLKIKSFDPEANMVFLFNDEVLPAEKKTKISNLGVMASIKKDFSTHYMMKEILSIIKEHVRELKREERAGTILIVDDEADIRSMISNFLSMKGYRVATASTGEEAILQIKSQKPQLVLCDIRMSGMDGLMVLKKIREIDSEIKVVMLSAIQDEDIVKEALARGAEDYIIKPCSLVKLDALALSILPH